MNDAEFVALVKQMRVIQRRFYSPGRLPSDLETAKSLERQVDKAIKNYEAPPGLFDREPAA